MSIRNPFTELSERAFLALGGPGLVYVRPVRAAEIVEEPDVEALAEQGIELDTVLYAVHRVDGERLAIMIDRDAAIAASIAHDLAPVLAH